MAENPLRRLRQLAVLASSASVLAAAGCGGSSDASTDTHVAPAEMPTIRCIARAGARIARSPDDLRFFFGAQADGSAEHPSTLFTNRWTVAVARWQNVPGAPYLRVWAAQRLHSGELSSVKELVTKSPSGAYVAFVRRAHPRAVQGVENCLSAVYGSRGAPVK